MITDGVFSMEGEEADLRELVRICEKHGAVLAVDDSHATGVLGTTGRGTAEEQGVMDRIPVTTGTLGKAMGSAAGGFVTGPKALVETLRQRSRTYLFSNSLPPAVAAGSLEAFRMLREDPAPVAEAPRQRGLLPQGDLGGRLPDPHGTHPIVPVIVGDTAKALAMGKALFEEGVYVSGFGFPVVPQGQARLRCQVSAAHERADLDRAVDAFRKVGKEVRRNLGPPSRHSEERERTEDSVSVREPRQILRVPSALTRDDPYGPSLQLLPRVVARAARRGRRRRWRRGCRRDQAVLQRPGRTSPRDRAFSSSVGFSMCRTRVADERHERDERRRRASRPRRDRSSRAFRRRAPISSLRRPPSSSHRSTRSFIMPPIQIGNVVESGR